MAISQTLVRRRSEAGSTAGRLLWAGTMKGMGFFLNYFVFLVWETVKGIGDKSPGAKRRKKERKKNVGKVILKEITPELA